MKTVEEKARDFVEDCICFNNEEERDLCEKVFIAGFRLGQQDIANSIASIFTETNAVEFLNQAFEQALSKK